MSLHPRNPLVAKAAVDLLIARRAEDSCIKDNVRLDDRRRLVAEERHEQKRKRKESELVNEHSHLEQ